MRSVTMTSAGPSRQVVGCDAGETVVVSLSNGAILEVSADVVQWVTLATSSGPVNIPANMGERVAVRFNLPVYPGNPVTLTIQTGVQ